MHRDCDLAGKGKDRLGIIISIRNFIGPTDCKHANRTLLDKQWGKDN